MGSVGAKPTSGLEYVLGYLPRVGYWGWRVLCRYAAGTNALDASWELSQALIHRVDSFGLN